MIEEKHQVDQHACLEQDVKHKYNTQSKYLFKAKKDSEYYTIENMRSKFFNENCNYRKSMWLSHFIKTSTYKNMKYEGKQIHPLLVFVIVTGFWKIVWISLIKGKVINVPYLGTFFKIRNKDKTNIGWSNKPNPFLKMETNSFVIKTVNK